jgi:predicted PurR-regulated permease PerM
MAVRHHPHEHGGSRLHDELVGRLPGSDPIDSNHKAPYKARMPKRRGNEKKRPPKPPPGPALASAAEVFPVAAPRERDARTHDTIAIAFFFLLLLMTLAASIYLFSGYLNDLILALLVIASIGPMQRRFEALFRGRVWLAAIASCVVVAIVTLGPFVFLVVSLSTEAAHLYATARESVTLDRLQGYLFGEGIVAQNARRVAAFLGIEYTPEAVKGFLGGAVAGIASFLYKQANALLANVLKVLFHFGIILLMTYYLIVDGSRLKEYVVRLSPLPDDEDELIGAKFRSVGRAILVGNGATSVAQGVLGGIAMYVAGLPSPVLWGTVMAILAFLPLIGVSAVVIPAAIYLFVEDRYVAAILFFVFASAQAFVLDNIVKTKMIGSQMRMHDLLIFLSVLGGIGLFGFIGILYGPLLFAILMVLFDLYEARYRRELLRTRGATH